jgi:hypothetical protein
MADRDQINSHAVGRVSRSVKSQRQRRLLEGLNEVKRERFYVWPKRRKDPTRQLLADGGVLEHGLDELDLGYHGAHSLAFPGVAASAIIVVQLNLIRRAQSLLSLANHILKPCIEIVNT